MSGVAERIDRLQNPEYTGANRCTPCTIVNSVLAGILAAVVWAVLAIVVETATVAAVAAVVTLVASAASIYFRGYLVPGTPTLTKRYFPDRVLAYFEKAPPSPADGMPDDAPWAHTYNKAPTPEKDREDVGPDHVDVEATLLEADVLEECEDVEDLCLDDDFETDWITHAEEVHDDDASRDRLIDLLDIEDAEVEFKEYDSAFRVVANGSFVGRWESRAAFLADVASGELLREWIDDWEDLAMADRSALLNGLRLFITFCPECGGEVAMNTRLVESCCRSHKVAALTCNDCEARLFESDELQA